MFKKEEKKQMKIVDKDGKIVENDIGFVQETLELCKNLTSLESHHFASYCSTGDEMFLKLGKIAREKRTKYLKMIAKGDGGQRWCSSKHICEILMRIQELTTRCMNTNDVELAKEISQDQKIFFEMFLEINGYTSKNITLGNTEA